MTITAVLTGFEDIGWDDLWPRKVTRDDSSAWVGGSMVVAVTRPFTAGEDVVFRWLTEQDAVELYGIYPLGDGRDLMVFDRLYLKQSRSEAVNEHREHLRLVLECSPSFINAT